MMTMLSVMNAQQFIQSTSEQMTLLHHAAFDKNLQAMEMMTNLPYFKEVVDDNSNEVFSPTLMMCVVWMDSSVVGSKEQGFVNGQNSS